MKATVPFHPLAIAVFPVASLYARNMSLVPWGDTLRPALFSLLGACLVWGALAALLRDVRRAAIGASVAIALIFSFQHLINLAPRGWIEHSYKAKSNLAPWYLGTTVIAAVAAMALVRRADKATRPLNAMATCLLALAASNIATSAWGLRSDGSSPQTVSGRAATKTPRLGARPDIFYIVLDGYGRSDVLGRVIGLDDSQFLNDLRATGFRVLDQSVANYCQTELSMASSLNMDYVQTLLPAVPADPVDRTPLGRLVDDNAVSRELRRAGYVYIAIGTGFPAFKFQSADVFIENASGTSLFEAAWISTTPLHQAGNSIRSQYDSKRDSIESAFDALARLGRRNARPKFVVAHLLVPHPPFVFGPEGQRRPPPRGAFGLWDGSHYLAQSGSAESYREGYRGQARYTASRILEVVASIRREASIPPIIVIQGDHGPKVNLNQDSPEPNAVDEVLPILNAIDAPDSLTADLTRSSTPVNTFRAILSKLIGLDLPPLPDRSYYSAWPTPYRWIEVTDALQHPAGRPLKRSASPTDG